MTFSRYLRLSGICLVVIISTQYVQGSPPPPTLQFGRSKLDKPGVLDLLAKVIKDRELSKAEYLKAKKSLPNIAKSNAKKSERPQAVQKHLQDSKPSLRSDLLRQELAKETQDNCLAKLLCGTVKTNSTPAISQPISDYAYLVKEFFDFFVDDPAEEEREAAQKKEAAEAAAAAKKNKKKQNDDDDEDEEDDNENDLRNDIVNITGSIVSFPDDEEVTTSTSATITSVTTGATITELPPLGSITYSPNLISAAVAKGGSNGVQKVTLEELVGDLNLTPKDFLALRQARQLRFKSTVSMGELRQSTYINRKLREMGMAKTDAKKLQIAGQIATTIRQPRQCRDFNKVASEILSTCPLTSEVVRYFNSNLKNGSQIALVKHSANNTDAGLVVLNDNSGSPHAYFLDNSPIVANTNINTDLKNPSVYDRFPINEHRHPVAAYESYSPQKFDYSGVVLENPPTPAPTKKKAKKKDEDDDDSDEEEDDNDEEGDADNDGDDEEDEENDEDDTQSDKAAELEKVNSQSTNADKDGDEDNDDDGDDDEENDQEENDVEILERSGLSSQSKMEKYRKSRPQRKRNPQLPPGIIKVYGVPQPSFDNEFSHISTQIGARPIFFDQDDWDSNSPPPPGQPPRSPVRPRPTRPQSNIGKYPANNNRRQQKISVPQPPPKSRKVATPQQSFSEEEEADEESSSEVQADQEQPISTAHFNNYPAPRPEEYYRNGRPPRPPPPTPYDMPMNYRRRPEVNVRGRLNFVHSSGSDLMRPYYNNGNNQNYRHYGK